MRKKYLINFRFNHFDPSLYVSTANIDSMGNLDTNINMREIRQITSEISETP